MQRIRSRLLILGGGGLLCLLAGCASSPPARFYLLTPLQDTASLPPQADNARQLTLGIDAVTLPEYLDRTEIVRQASTNQLDLAEFLRWAEPI